MADPIFVRTERERLTKNPKRIRSSHYRWSWLGGLALAVVAASSGASASPLAEQGTLIPPAVGFQPVVRTGTITKVSDGDTVHFLPAGMALSASTILKVRMMTEDTPELHLPAPGGMYSQGWWAEKATDVLADLIPVGSRVKLLDYGKDVYGRTLGRIFRKTDGLDVNREMIANGWGSLYLICSGETCTPDYFEREQVADHVAACEEAVRAKRGIHDPADPLPEMPFEFRLRIQKREPDKFVGNLKTRELHAPADYREVPLCDRLFFRSVDEAVALGFVPKESIHLAL
jgi:endonuclease YncB( thermonuclease family)